MLTNTTEIGTAILPLRSLIIPVLRDVSPSAHRPGLRPRLTCPPDPAPSAHPGFQTANLRSGDAGKTARARTALASLTVLAGRAAPGLLLALAALLALPVPAQAQTEVAADWALKPSAISAGGKFRLLIVTSTTRNPTSTTIGDYDTHVQNAVAAGHTNIRSYSSSFKVLGSTAAVDARDNTSTTYTNTDKGVPIYWLNGDKVADDYEDFYDGSWDSTTPRNESGNNVTGVIRVFTGSDNDGTDNTNPLGHATNVMRGDPKISTDGLQTSLGTPQTAGPYYGLSGVFQVAAGVTLPAITIAAKAATVLEGEAAVFTLTRTGVTTAALTVTVAISESGSMVDGGNEGDKEATFGTGSATVDYSVPTQQDHRSETDSVVTATLKAGTGYTLGATAAATVTVEDHTVAVTVELEPDGSETPIKNLSVDEGDNLVLHFVATTGSDHPPTGYVRVSILTREVTDGADAGSDFHGGFAKGVTFNVADFARENVGSGVMRYRATHEETLGTNEDSLSEGDETLNVALALSIGLITPTLIHGSNNVAAIVTIIDDDPAGAPTISGNEQVGQTLTASTNTITDPDGLTTVSYTYQWIRANGTDADITGATSSTYVLQAADLGKTIKVQVTFDDDDGNTYSLTSDATGTVAAAPANAAPSFSSSSTFNAAENQRAVGTVAADDTDSQDSVTGYAITGGADQARFSITSPGGALTFKAAPDFENPGDAAGNNEYVVVVTATSGAAGRALTTEQTITVTVTDVDEDDEDTTPEEPAGDPTCSVTYTGQTHTQSWPLYTTDYRRPGKASIRITVLRGEQRYVCGHTGSLPVGGNEVYCQDQPPGEYEEVRVDVCTLAAGDGGGDGGGGGTDPEPPLLPGLTVTPALAALEVSWDTVPATMNYLVLWKSGGQAYAAERRATVVPPTTSYTITGLRGGTEYTVKVRALSVETEEAEATGTPLSPEPPPPPPPEPEPDLAPSFGAAAVADQVWTAGAAIAPLVLPAATGGDGALTYALSPTLPAGVALDEVSRTVAGAPDAAQPATPYTWTATDEDEATATVTFTIRVDGPAPTLLTLSATPAPAEGGEPVTVTATLDNPALADGLTVTLTTGGTATLDTDYTLSSTTITFAEGETAGTVTITVTDDAEADDGETIVIDAESTTPALTAEPLTLTIEDNDVTPVPTLPLLGHLLLALGLTAAGSRWTHQRQRAPPAA